MTFEVGKTYKNRKGEDVLLICNFKNPPYTFLGIIRREGRDSFSYYMPDGKYGITASDNDLIPEKQTYWANSYKNNLIIKIEFSEGEGL